MNAKILFDLARPSRVLALATVLLAGFAEHARSAPVIDDRELVNSFEKKLGAFADEGTALEQLQVRELLGKVEGKQIAVPAPDNAISTDGIDGIYNQCLKATLIVGNVYDCGNCDEWHIGGAASGWIASACGIIVTNHHVLHNGEAGRHLGVITAEGDVFPIVEILACDADGDVAVAKIDTGGKELPYMRLASSWQVGEPVGVISHPRRRFFSFTKGVVSRFHRMPSKGESNPVFMTITADYAVGSSGGPVINSRGEVIGMVASTQTVTTSPRRDTGEQNETRRQGGGSVQMVFKDCCAPQALHALIGYPDEP
jgi:S1-C subfamily serine protease